MLGDGLREPLGGVEAGNAQANVKARVRHQRSSTGLPVASKLHSMPRRDACASLHQVDFQRLRLVPYSNDISTTACP